MSIKLTTGAVSEISGLPVATLDSWVVSGRVGPACAFEGTGRHREWSLGQTLAVVAGAVYRAEGATPERVAGIVSFLAGLSLEKLEAELEAGRTFPVPGAMMGTNRLPGMMIPPPAAPSPGVLALMKRLDLAQLYADVMTKVSQLSKPAGKTGRHRGLVT